MTIKRIWLPGFVNALFTVLTPNTIWVNKNRHCIEHLIEHEVCHREQFLRYGLIIYLLGKTWCNVIQVFGYVGAFEEEAYARQTNKEMEVAGL